MRFAPLRYPTAQAWRQAERKHVLLFGMSGLGKTYLSALLREAGGWFHYSVDYRIGTHYMGEHIADSFKREAMKVPYLADLLRSDSIYIGSNITFENLDPLSTYLGKPGDRSRGGLHWDEYRRRQAAHRDAEMAALRDAPRFIARAEEIYGYRDFICDSGGSICEVVNPEDADDAILSTLAEHMLLVWLEGSEAHRQELVRRFDKQPKPMYYQPSFLGACRTDYLAERKVEEDAVDPDDFVRFTYGRALAHRQPRYAAMARHWGLAIPAERASTVRTTQDFEDVIAEAIERVAG